MEPYKTRIVEIEDEVPVEAQEAIKDLEQQPDLNRIEVEGDGYDVVITSAYGEPEMVKVQYSDSGEDAWDVDAFEDLSTGPLGFGVSSSANQNTNDAGYEWDGAYISRRAPSEEQVRDDVPPGGAYWAPQAWNLDPEIAEVLENLGVKEPDENLPTVARYEGSRGEILAEMEALETEHPRFIQDDFITRVKENSPGTGVRISDREDPDYDRSNVRDDGVIEVEHVTSAPMQPERQVKVIAPGDPRQFDVSDLGDIRDAEKHIEPSGEAEVRYFSSDDLRRSGSQLSFYPGK